MSTSLLTKKELARRWGTSEKSISTACSRNPASLPRLMKLGFSKNSPIRFRLEDVLAFEEEMLKRQEQAVASQIQEPDLAQLLGL